MCAQDNHVKNRAEAAAGRASQGTQQGMLSLISNTLRQLLRGVGERLKKTPQSEAAPSKQERGVERPPDVSSVEALEKEQRQSSPAANANDLRISFRIVGTPPSPQIITVTANRPVTISRLEYLLPDDRCIVSQEYSLEGVSVELPISHQCVDEVYNAPRPTGDTYESSLKFRVTTFEGERTRTYTFSAQITVTVAEGTVYRRVSGSKYFVSEA
jgi:hypothetical protein